jgi:ATP-dependent RNA helicase RhlE
VCVDEDIFLADIEKLIKRSIPREVVPGFERSQHERAEPIVLGRMTIGVGASRGGRSGGGGGSAVAIRRRRPAAMRPRNRRGATRPGRPPALPRRNAAPMVRAPRRG